MKRRFVRQVMAVAAAVGATFVVSAGNIDWKPQNGSADITDPANWNGGELPGVGSLARITNVAGVDEYRLVVPDEGATFKSGFFFDGIGDGQTAIIDATKGRLLVQTDPGVAWDSNIPLRIRSWDHIFDVDNAHVPGNTANQFGFSLANGTLSFKRDLVNGSVLTIDGDFNNAILDDGTESNHRTVLFHCTNGNSKNSKIVFRSGDSKMHNVHFRGKTADNEWRIEGGHLHCYGGLQINTDSTGVDTTALLHVTDEGQLTIENNTLWIGANADGLGKLLIDGNGKVEVGSGATITYIPNDANQRGLLSIGGHGVWSSAKNINVGQYGGTADILVEENGTFEMQPGSWLNFGSHNGCNISLTLKDDAYGHVPNASLVKDCNGNPRTGTIDLSGNAILDFASNGDIANSDGSVLTINMRDNAQLRAKRTDGNNWLLIGNNSASTVNLNFEGGTISPYETEDGEFDHFQLKVGPRSTVNFAGVTLNTQNFAIEGKSDKSVPDAWHIVHQTAGTVNVRQRGRGDGLDIRGGNGRNCMYSLEGGTLTVGANMMRIGHNTTTAEGETWRSVFRQTGGQANLGCNVNLCDSDTSGEIELLGGRTRLNAIRGWSKCFARGGKYMARGYFNGGTIEPWQNNITIIYTMTELKLGEKGLTVDTLDFTNVAVEGLFENEGEADGLFVKTGTGTLKAKMKEVDSGAKGDYVNRPLLSTHTYTRINQGTLQMTEAEEVAFGKNISVKGGATLSLEGMAKTLTVDTLTLGDGTPFATLKVDSGDTIVVKNDNGLTAASAQLDAPWITAEGTYPIFKCEGAVDVEQLENIGLKNAPAGKDVGWTTETDGDGITTCSVVIAPAGSLTSSIAYADGTGTKTGTGPVSGISGSGTATDTLKLAHSVIADIADGEALTLAGDLKGTDAVLTKTGSGKLTVSGNNANLGASFSSQGGTLDLVGLEAFGALNYPVVLGNGTFKYTGEPAIFTGGLELNGATAGKSVILENDGDMTFDKISHVAGTFIKKGTGTLTLNLPAGTFYGGHSNVDGNYGVNEGALVFPASGDAPETKAGLCGFTIAEGTFKVKGAGVDKTTFNTDNTAILATSYAAKAAPILEVEDARVNFGKASHHARFMLDYPASAPMPEIRLKNAYLYANSGYWGGTTDVSQRGGYIKISLKDSVAWGDYNTFLGYAGFASVTLDADNSRFETDGTQLLIAAKFANLDFHGEGAVFGSFNDLMDGANNAGYITSHDHPQGEITIRDGARMKTTRGVKLANSQLNVTFDGGIFEIVPHQKAGERDKTSLWMRAGKGFTTAGKGLEVAICEGSTHGFNFPIMGEGSVTKTGAGTFKLVEPRTEGEKLLQSTGTLTVSEGTMVLDGALVANEIDVVVEEGAVLDLNGSTLKAKSITGKGTVINGTVKLTQVPYTADGWAMMGEGASIAAGTIEVDFTGCTFTKAQYAEGIVITTYSGTAPRGLVLKAINVDPTVVMNPRSQTLIEDGKVILKVAPSGFVILVR